MSPNKSLLEVSEKHIADYLKLYYREIMTSNLEEYVTDNDNVAVVDPAAAMSKIRRCNLFHRQFELFLRWERLRAAFSDTFPLLDLGYPSQRL